MKIEMYTTTICPYCIKAKAILRTKNVEWVEYNIQLEDDKMEEMIHRTKGRKTVPQIFINDKYIGGYDELYSLDLKSELDPLLV